MHILHIALGGCLRAPPVIYGITPDTGGHIAYVLEAAQAQAACSHVDHVTIATRRFDNESLGAIHDREIEHVSDKITILRLGPQGAAYREKDEALADLQELGEALCRFVRHSGQRFDVIHCHFADAVIVGQALARLTNAPVLYTPHALGIDKLDAGGLDCPALRARIERERRALNAADGVIVSTSNEAAQQVPRYGVSLSPTRLRTIAPGTPGLADAHADHGREFLARYASDPERALILAIARPVEKKNLVFLAQTYAQSPALQARANLVILCGQHERLVPGSEDDRVVAQLLHIRQRHGLETCFALPRAHDAQIVAGLYRLAAAQRGVFVNPARHEPFGLTLLEAASVGLPVIATDRGGPVDIVRTLGHGILVSPDSHTDLGDALTRILGEPALWHMLSRAALQASPALGWESYAAESTLFYSELIEARATKTDFLARTVSGLIPALSGLLGGSLPPQGIRVMGDDIRLAGTGGAAA